MSIKLLLYWYLNLYKTNDVYKTNGFDSVTQFFFVIKNIDIGILQPLFKNIVFKYKSPQNIKTKHLRNFKTNLKVKKQSKMFFLNLCTINTVC